MEPENMVLVLAELALQVKNLAAHVEALTRRIYAVEKDLTELWDWMGNDRITLQSDKPAGPTPSNN